MRITGHEEESLRKGSKNSGKSMGELVREGYLRKIEGSNYPKSTDPVYV
jgi:hypothetical protein